jgi:hypothetical protein
MVPRLYLRQATFKWSLYFFPLKKHVHWHSSRTRQIACCRAQSLPGDFHEQGFTL